MATFKLGENSKIIYITGQEGAGKVLVSNNNGEADWQLLPVSGAVWGQITGNINNQLDLISLLSSVQAEWGNITGNIADQTDLQSALSAATIYNLSSPSTIALGGVPSGYTLTGQSIAQIIEKLLVVYLPPAFTSFSISGQSSVIEVGTALAGSKTFVWSTSNSGNVQTNSIAIRDVNTNTLLASGLSNDGSEALSIGTITNTSPISQNWRAEGVNTQLSPFLSSNFNVSSIYPYFYGKVASGGAAPGVNRPLSNQSLINSGTAVVSDSNGTITISFNSTSDDYIWFAIPSISNSKNVWFIDSLNNGAIGGSVSPGGNLFPDFDTVSINSPSALWSGVSYKIYVSNFQTAVSAAMQLRNS